MQKEIWAAQEIESCMFQALWDVEMHINMPEENKLSSFILYFWKAYWHQNARTPKTNKIIKGFKRKF